jgi:hypothetical protein
MSLKHLGVTKLPTSALIGKGKKKQRSMLDVNLPLLAHYACEDADCTLRLHGILSPVSVLCSSFGLKLNVWCLTSCIPNVCELSKF